MKQHVLYMKPAQAIAMHNRTVWPTPLSLVSMPLVDVHLLAFLDDVVKVMRRMPRSNWRVARVMSPPTGDQMRVLVGLNGARAVHEWGSDGPMVLIEAVDDKFTSEPFPNGCDVVGVDRADVVADVRDANSCTMRVRVVGAVILSLRDRARFLVSSRANGEGYVVNAGLIHCDVALRIPNLVVMWRKSDDARYDSAMQLHPGSDHELLYVDVQFRTGPPRRLYIELTPGQVSGLSTDATKATFWEPPSVYSNLLDNPNFVGDYGQCFDTPGWESYTVVVQRVCEGVLSSELRQAPVDLVRRFVRECRSRLS